MRRGGGERSAHVGRTSRPTALPQPGLRGRAGAGGGAAKGPVVPCVPRAYDCALFLYALHRAPRACALGRASVLGGVHVGQARDFVFVEVAPCPCGQPLAYAVCDASGVLWPLWAATRAPCFAVSLAVGGRPCLRTQPLALARGRRGCARRTRQSPRSSCRPCAGSGFACGTAWAGAPPQRIPLRRWRHGGAPRRRRRRPALSCFTASAARRSAHVSPSKVPSGGVPAHAEGGWLHLDKHAEGAPPGSRGWSRGPRLVART
jgi:hypothetical protein